MRPEPLDAGVELQLAAPELERVGFEPIEHSLARPSRPVPLGCHEVVDVEMFAPRELRPDDEPRDAENLAGRFEVCDPVTRSLLLFDLRDQCVLRERGTQLEQHVAGSRELGVGLGDLDAHRNDETPLLRKAPRVATAAHTTKDALGRRAVYASTCADCYHRAMPREIEHKFLLKSPAWRAEATRVERMTQGYIAGGERASVRVRVAGDYAAINIKSGGLVASRLEYEYQIPVEQANELLDLCVPPLIEKTRHFVPFGGFEWEIDEFHGANAGLIVAELELDHEDQRFPLPAWIGAEVTHLERYYNVRLAKHPYRDWTDSERAP